MREIIEQKTKEIGIKMVELANYSSFNTPDEQKNNIKNIAQESAKQMADWLLNNLWISVEDELPKTSNGFSKDVLCIDNRGCIIVAKYQDGVGWWSRGGTHWNTNGFTHWMPIPTLKGGKKCKMSETCLNSTKHVMSNAMKEGKQT